LYNRNAVLMQLTEQDCSHQPALMYIENQCIVKSFKLFEKMFDGSSIVLVTQYNSYLTF